MTLAVPTSASSYVWSSILLLVLPIALTAVALWGTTGNVFGGGARPIVVSVYAGVAILGVGLMASMTRSDVRMVDGELILRGSLYKRAIKLSDIDPSTVAVHAESDAPSLGFRTNGIGLPGYSAGWFRRRNGDRVFVVYGGGPHVSFKTRDGVHHVIGTANAQELYAALVAA